MDTMKGHKVIKKSFVFLTNNYLPKIIYFLQQIVKKTPLNYEWTNLLVKCSNVPF